MNDQSVRGRGTCWSGLGARSQSLLLTRAGQFRGQLGQKLTFGLPGTGLLLLGGGGVQGQVLGAGGAEGRVARRIDGMQRRRGLGLAGGEGFGRMLPGGGGDVVSLYEKHIEHNKNEQ